MATTITIDASGRLVLPRPVRDRLHLMAGSRLDLEIESGSVRLTPVPDDGIRLVRSGKRLVISGTPPLAPGDVARAIAADREDRSIKLGTLP